MLIALFGCPDPGNIVFQGDDTGVADTADDTDSAPTRITGSQPGDSAGDSDEPEDTAEAAEDEAIFQAFYDPLVMHEVRIELSAESIAALDRDGRTYVEGHATVDGTRFENVGVRLKGSTTYQDFSGKPSFKIKLDEFEDGQKYGTLQRLTLNNMTSDSSQSREIIDYWIWNQSDIFASRASYATVYVNDELFGLYLNLESLDDEWVERRYLDAEGDLWASALDSAEFGTQGLAVDQDGVFRNWDLESGEGDQDKLFAVRDALDEGGSYFGPLDADLDTTQFLKYWALNVTIGNADGYPWNLNDVFLYVDPADGRIDMIPWGMDEAWNEGLEWDGVRGRVAAMCMNDADCVAALKEETRVKLDFYDSLDVLGFAQQVWALSEDAVLGDPRSPFTPGEVSDARDYLSGLILTRSDEVREDMGL